MNIKTEQQFIELIAPAVIENCRRHGWGVPSAIIAQATLESMKSAGWSGLASTCFNFWGMKWVKNCGCDFKEYITQEQKPNGSYYTVSAKFRKYPTIEGAGGGIDGYFKFIESYKRYARVMQAKDYKTYATEIRLAGWATSLKYTQNIINKVEKLNLTRFDSAINNNLSELDKIAYDVINGVYGSGEERKKLLGNRYAEVQKRVNEILKG